jgi:hypothetical protein
MMKVENLHCRGWRMWSGLGWRLCILYIEGRKSSDVEGGDCAVFVVGYGADVVGG